MSNRLGRGLEQLATRGQYRTVARGIFIVLGIALVYWLSVWIQEKQYAWSLVPTVLLAIVGLFEFILTDAILDSRFPRESRDFLDRLQKKLRTTSINAEILDALTMCIARFQGCNVSNVSSALLLRVEVHSQISDRPEPALIQLSDYTRPGLGGRKWRLTPETKGIVGRCLRTKELSSVNFRDAAEFRDRMVREFGFRVDELEKHTMSARSYLAYPIVADREIVGVLYFFSTEPQVFPVAAEEVALSDCASQVAGLLRAAEVL